MTLSSVTARLFAFIETSQWRAMLVLFLLALFLFVPGQSGLPPMDRDEPRFAQASRQMLETGDLVDIRFQTEARHKKPVGIYWMQAGTVAVAQALGIPQAHQTIWLYRLPSLAGAILVVLLTYWAALPLAGARGAFVAAILVAASILLGVEARLAKTDAVLSATIVAAMGVLARAWMGQFPGGHGRDEPLAPERLGFGLVLVFWLALGLSILIKGPIGIAVVGLGAFTLALFTGYWRWLRALRPLPGLLLMMAVVAPWFLAITLKTGGSFFAASVGQDMLGKVAEGQESHFAWPGTYIAVLTGTFWPVSPFFLLSLPFIWHARRERAVAFCIAWALPMWLVFELVPTKLPHYVLPLYPALAILVVLAAASAGIVVRGVVARFVMLLLPAPVLLLAGALAVLAWMLERTLPWAALSILGVAFLFTLAAWRAFAREQIGSAAVAACLASGFVSLAIYGFGIPAIKSLSVSSRLAEAARGVGCAAPVLATTGFREPSLVFLTRTDLVMTDGAGAARFLGEGPCRVVFVEKRQEGAFKEGLATAQPGPVPRLVARVEGININGGRRLDIGVYAREGD